MRMVVCEEIDAEVLEYCKDAQIACEISTFERYALLDLCYKKYNVQERGSGIFRAVGRIDDRQICISVSTINVDGIKVIFYEPTSVVVDHDKIRDWVCKATSVDHTTNAENFMNKLRDVLNR